MSRRSARIIVLGTGWLLACSAAHVQDETPRTASVPPAAPARLDDAGAEAAASTGTKHESGRDANDDFAGLEVAPTLDSGQLCLVVRDVSPGASVAFVDLAYVNGGKLAKREHWRVPRSGAPNVREWTRIYQWKGDRLASWEGEGGLVTYDYDGRGLPTTIEAVPLRTGGVYTRVDLRWDVRPRSRAPTTYVPRSSAPDPLPWYLPYQGTVRIERLQGKVAPLRSAGTFVYDANGILRLPKWKYAATGEPLGNDEATWTWSGDRIVEQSWAMTPFPATKVVYRGRAKLEYDDAKRLKRKVRFEVPDSGPPRVEHETRYAHLCEGDLIEDPIWP